MHSVVLARLQLMVQDWTYFERVMLQIMLTIFLWCICLIFHDFPIIILLI